MAQVNPSPINFHLENPHEPENNEVIIQLHSKLPDVSFKKIRKVEVVSGGRMFFASFDNTQTCKLVKRH